jgi:hypothetical protein
MMSNNTPAQIHALIPIVGAVASIAGILTGAYGLATSDAGKKHPVLVKVGMGAAILGLGFLLYREVLTATKPEPDKKQKASKASILGVRG